jgi:hypothetical protein
MPYFEVPPDVDVGKSRSSAQDVPSVREVLEELFVLLEDYAPTWYTKEHHDRVISAILKREQ